MADLTLWAPPFEIVSGTNAKISVGKSALLIYDDRRFSAVSLRKDVVGLIDSTPYIDRIYIAAPLHKIEHIINVLKTHFDGSESVLHGATEDFLFINRVYLVYYGGSSKAEICAARLTSSLLKNSSLAYEVLQNDFLDAWLFDAFAKFQGIVYAPKGVHFGKTSTKHSEVFLRAANVFQSTAFCRFVALLLLPRLFNQVHIRIVVDTAPLISVGLATLELCHIHEIKIEKGSVDSFSSYEGLDKFTFTNRDVVLVSASTSGNLSKKIQGKLGEKSTAPCITLFHLRTKGGLPADATVLVDLTHTNGRNFGFSPVESYSSDMCPWCKSGKLLAQFEGDQFLLQKRRTLPIFISKKSQTAAASQFFEQVCRHEAVKVSTRSDGAKNNRGLKSDLVFDMEKVIKKAPTFAALVQRKLRRALPTPLDVVTYPEGFNINTLWSWAALPSPQEKQFTHKDVKELSSTPRLENGGAIAVFPVVNNEIDLRETNRLFRNIVPKGNVSYFSLLHLTASPEDRHDLSVFLKWGEIGPNTFFYESVHSLLVLFSHEVSFWERELQILNDLFGNLGNALDPLLQQRIVHLSDNSELSSELFLPSQCGPLTIANDFVFLDTSTDKQCITQADVYAIVSNLISCSVNDDRDAAHPTRRGDTTANEHSVALYGQRLLAPANFLDFNDGVLHAAMLRSCPSSLLAYDTDISFSELILGLILSEIDSWTHENGKALGEFVMALAVRKLQLADLHTEKLKAAITNNSAVPLWIKQICSAIR
jgi:hypothetical protein